MIILFLNVLVTNLYTTTNVINNIANETTKSSALALFNKYAVGNIKSDNIGMQDVIYMRCINR